MLNIKSKGDELLETKLNEATNPLNPVFNAAAVTAFCDEVIKEPEGHQVAVRLLAHKVQSPQEKEALYAFSVIDECVKRCGFRFHQEIGKFRFLNELIKIISPKYLARNTSPSVKKRCTECLYCLYRGIPHETKITEAYVMLKKQHIITKDPTYLDDKIFKVNDSQSQSHSIFDSSKDSEKLSRLLKSRNPDDLREANRIIKSIVQEDNQRMEMLSKRASEIDTMRNNMKLLTEMMSCYNAQETTADDLDIMKQLVENLETSRSEMFKLSRETEDTELINDIISVIDECNSVIKRYTNVISGIERLSSDTHTDDNQSQTSNPNTDFNLLGDEHIMSSSNMGSNNILSNELSQLGLDTPTSQQETVHPSTTSINRYDELMDIFNVDSVSDKAITEVSTKHDVPLNFLTQNGGNTSNNPTPTYIIPSTNNTFTFKNSQQKPDTSNQKYSYDTNTAPITKSNNTNNIKGFEDLDILSKELMSISKKKEEVSMSNEESVESLENNNKNTNEMLPAFDLPDEELLSSLQDKQLNILHQDMPLLNTDLLGDTITMTTTPKFTSTPKEVNPIKFNTNDPTINSNHQSQSTISKDNAANIPDLTQFNLTLNDIKLHPLKLPMTIYNNQDNKIKITLHFGHDSPHPQVFVMVAQVANESSYSVTDLVLKFAVTKPMKIRKIASGINSLQPHSPFTPSTPMNEIVLLYNPTKTNVDMRFQLSYDINGESILESGTTGSIGW